MHVAMSIGTAGVPERFWRKAVAETEDEVEQLKKQGYIISANQPTSRSEAIKWLNR